MKKVVAIILVMLTGVSAVFSESAGPDIFDFGPIASRRVNVHGEVEFNALGPFYQRVQASDGSVYWGLRPFYATLFQQAKNRKTAYYLWPLAYTKLFYEQFQWRCLLAWGLHGEISNPDSDYYRFRIFPVYYQGRDHEDRFYVGVFPVGGQVRDLLFFNRVDFFLFPIWSRWWQSGLQTLNILWPVYSRSTGENVAGEYVHRYGVFPFYRVSEHEDIYWKKSVLWPFWNWARYLTPGRSGYSYIVWPLWGRTRQEHQQGWMFLPPLFRFEWGEGGTLVLCPWPFFRYRHDKNIRYLYIWPLWGKRDVGEMHTQYLLWPLCWRRQWDKGFVRVRNYQVVPFYIAQTGVRMTRDGEETDEIIQRFLKLWPLFSYRREGASRQFRTLELWPFFGTREVDRTWAPLWTVYAHRAMEDRRETTFLWGLYRSQAVGDRQRYVSLFPLFSWQRDSRCEEPCREWSLLKGLAGCKTKGDTKTFRLLYFMKFKFGNKETKP